MLLVLDQNTWNHANYLYLIEILDIITAQKIHYKINYTNDVNIDVQWMKFPNL